MLKKIAGVVCILISGLLCAEAETSLNVVNGDFEKPLGEGWNVFENKENAKVEIAPGEGHNGGNALKISAAEKAKVRINNFKFRPEMKENTIYQFEAWIKCEKVEGNGAGIALSSFNNKEHKFGWINNLGGKHLEGSSGWENIKVRFTSLSRKSYLNIQIRFINSSGSAYFDDIKVCEIAKAETFSKDYTGIYYRENFENLKSKKWREGYDFLDKTKTTVKIVTAKDGIPLPPGGHALSIEGENKWNTCIFPLDKLIPLNQEVYIKANIWSDGCAEGGDLNLGALGQSPTHSKTAPSGVKNHGGKWATGIWKASTFFPAFQYENPENLLLNCLMFAQRVKGGHEKPGGKADFHRLVIDNIEIASAPDGRCPFTKEADELGGIRYYQGRQNYMLENKDGLKIWHAPSSARVFRKQPVPEKKENSVKISGGRNEYESFQIVLTSPEELKNISVKPGELKGPDGKIISPEQFTVHPVVYVPIYGRFFGVACDGSQYWPEPLSWNSSFDVKKDINQPVWLTVYIPEGIPAGNYSGNIEIFRDGKKSASIPLELKVWDFDFPLTVSYRTNQQLWIGGPGHWSKKSRLEQRMGGEELLGMYHMVDANLFSMIGAKNQDMLIEKYGSNTIKLPFCGGHRGGVQQKPTKFKGFEPRTEEYEEALSEWVKKQADSYRKRGLLDRCFLYLWDEPWGDFETVKLIAYIGGIVKKAAPDLQTLVAAPSYKELMPVTDIFLAGYTEPEKRKEALAEGKTFWWWSNAFTFGDMPALDVRLSYGFESIAKKINGSYAWGFYVLTTARRKITVNPPKDYPFTNPWKVPSRANYADTVIWPGSNPFSRPDRLVPSITLAALREGIEDYEYYAMIKKKMKNASPELKKKCEKLLAEAEKFYKAPEKARRNDFSQVDSLQELRAKMAILLEQLK